MFQNIGDFHENHTALFILYFYFLFSSFVLLPSCFSLFIARHPLWIGPNEPRSQGRKKSIVHQYIYYNSLHIWVHVVQNSSSALSFLLYASDPFPLSSLWSTSVDRPRLVFVVTLSSFLLYFSLCYFFVKNIILISETSNTHNKVSFAYVTNEH